PSRRPVPAPTREQLGAAYPPSRDEASVAAGEKWPTTAPPAAEPNDAAKAAERLFSDARDLYRSGKYAEAQTKVEQAIKELPSDATLHEFRSLTLFAQGNYKDAAAGLYAVLAAGPGWDWETMKYFYRTETTYTDQLRSLHDFVKTHPPSAYHPFP